MLAGVCGGLGSYFDVNPLFYRIGFVVLSFLGGAGFLVYGAALLVIERGFKIASSFGLSDVVLGEPKRT